jgi:DNA-binding transcriptional regulator LsrR (DeoR family)
MLTAAAAAAAAAAVEADLRKGRGSCVGVGVGHALDDVQLHAPPQIEPNQARPHVEGLGGRGF